MKGVYIAHKNDDTGTAYAAFSAEKDALRYAIENPGHAVGFVEFGKAFGVNEPPKPKAAAKKATATSEEL